MKQEKDGDNDKGSRLNRPGVYRVNLGVRKDTFVKLFGAVPKRPGGGRRGCGNVTGRTIKELREKRKIMQKELSV